jgi:hypothetical protein
VGQLYRVWTNWAHSPMLALRGVDCRDGQKDRAPEGDGRGSLRDASVTAMIFIPGTRFGKLLITGITDFSGGHRRYQCYCACGNHRFVRATKLRCGVIEECSICAKKNAAIKGGRTRRLPGTEAAVRQLFAEYKTNARRRNLRFDLNVEQFLRLCCSACFFCGEEPRSSYYPKGGGTPLLRNGIDRRDNRKGYLEDNCVAACATCNYAKREMGTAQFLEWVRRVAKHHVGLL